MQASTLGGASCRWCRASLSRTVFFSQLTTTPSPLLSPPQPLHSRRWSPTTTFHSTPKRSSSSASSSQWKARQSRDQYAKRASVQGLKSRAAFKLLEMDKKYRLFRRNQVVIDLGYAPGSWSQVAVERTKPRGLVVGIDLIPAQPPRGATSIQGDFLHPHVQKLVKDVLLEQYRRRKRQEKELKALERERRRVQEEEEEEEEAAAAAKLAAETETETETEMEEQGEDSSSNGGVDVGEGGSSSAVGGKEEEEEELRQRQRQQRQVVMNANGEDIDIVGDRPSYIDMGKIAGHDIEEAEAEEEDSMMVDIVLSDMSEPWPQTTGFMSNTLSNPHRRLMNTSGMAFRDHMGSMDLCHAALQFASDTLKPNGHFICKFYQGSEDKLLEAKLKKMFTTVHRSKPDSSRKDSKEAFFVALRRKPNVTLADIEGR